MRKFLLIGGSILGAIIIVVVGLVVYAVVNLNSIIAANRTYILTQASDALGRPVQVQDIKASVGWGVKMDLQGVKVADNPAFSQVPFVQASNVYVDVEFIPLLARQIKVTRLVLDNPQVRVIKNKQGVLNISTLSHKSTAAAGAAPSSTRPRHPAAGAPGLPTEAAPKSSSSSATAMLGGLSIRNFSIDDGRIYYEDRQTGGSPITVNRVNLTLDNFSFHSPFDISLTMAALGDQKNLSLSGTIGPVIRNNTLDINTIPLDFKAGVGPLSIAQAKSIPALAKAIPAVLTISGPVNVNAKIGGTVGVTRFDVASDLTANHVAYAGDFDKPAGVPFKFNGSGSRSSGGKLEIGHADLTLGGLNAKAANISLASGNIGARIDTNRFDLASVAKMLPVAQKYNPTGNAEVHADVKVANHKPSMNGSVTLADVGVSVPGGSAPPIHALSGTIKVAGNTANVGPITFDIGSGHAKLQASADSLQPLHATYQFNIDTLKLADIAPSRKSQGNEEVNQLAASGTISKSGTLQATTRLTSASGMVANVPYTNLAMAGSYGDNRAKLDSLKINAFDGSVGASGVATMGATPSFNLALNCANLNIEKALEAQKSKAANTIRGILDGQIQIAGSGSKFDQIKPTLKGSGKASIANGKLVGVNVVAQALQKVDNVPGIGALVPMSVVNNHPELFKSPDTDIKQASLTFQIQGPRISTNDLTVSSADYSILGKGWFDMDKNVDMDAQILMSRPFSNELVAAKRNVSYLTDRNGQVEIPLKITGQLPKPSVLPNVTVLAQRAASHAVENKIGGFLGKKGLGGIFGGGGSSASPTPQPKGQPTPFNPISPFKKLF